MVSNDNTQSITSATGGLTEGLTATFGLTTAGFTTVLIGALTGTEADVVFTVYNGYMVNR